MSGWNPTPSTLNSGWVTAHIQVFRNWKPECPKSPECKPIIKKRPTDMVLESDVHTKGPKLNNGALFYLLPMDIINVVNNWLIGIEH